MDALQIEGLTKTYINGRHSLNVLQDVSFVLAEGDSCAIVGPSGSGKTTLLGLCAGLDGPTSGTVNLLDVQLESLTEDERAAVRNRYVGFVFQNFQLIPTLTAVENVMVPLELRGDTSAGSEALSLLERVGLTERASHYPTQLSGGEQQRVAIARAFINRPRVLFADEPTGNLDADTSENVEDLLFELNRETGVTLMVATHDMDLAEKTGRIIRLQGGVVVSDTGRISA
jgi:putative ABC transport system ATP-binding protein